MNEMQARVAQETAIAARIAQAEEVEIEEYYEAEGKGSVGAKGDSEGIMLGLGVAGRKVTKRVYRFKGGSSLLPPSKEADA